MIKPSFRFHTLDGLRGLAAIAVMLYHYTNQNGLHWLSGSWVAVDIFYILSGFVIAHSYGNKITQGFTFPRYLISRLVRLGPLYLIGLVIGIIALIYVMAGATKATVSNESIISAGLLNLFFIPYLNDIEWPFAYGVITGPVFPLNNPAWSLFFELFVNIVFFIYLRWGGKIQLEWLVLFALLVYTGATVWFRDINTGWATHNFFLGFPRVISEFFLGALIYKYRDKYKAKNLLCGFVFVVVMVGFFLSSPKLGLINSLLFAPILIALAAKVEVNGWGVPGCKFLGDISYPLYITHFPIYALLIDTPYFKNSAPVFSVLAISAVTICIAIALIRVDFIVRSKLSTRFNPKAKKIT